MRRPPQTVLDRDLFICNTLILYCLRAKFPQRLPSPGKHCGTCSSFSPKESGDDDGVVVVSGAVMDLTKHDQRRQFGLAVKGLRRASNLTQTALAARSGLPMVRVSRLERG